MILAFAKTKRLAYHSIQRLGVITVVISFIVTVLSGLMYPPLVSAETVAATVSATTTGPAQPKPPPADYIDPLGIAFMWIKPGEFTMGRDSSDELGYDSELPQHQVQIRQGFYMAKYELTQGQWRKVNPRVPGEFKGDALPVDSVSFDDIKTFIATLNQRDPNLQYQLPSEAQWEYAARAGTKGRYYYDGSEGLLGQYGWYLANSAGTTHEVGLLAPNDWGLYDMYGNVAEWVQDCWHSNYLDAPDDGSAWLATSGWFAKNCKSRGLRGGSWYSPSFELRSSFRYHQFKFQRSPLRGFRLVLNRSE